ncbi:Retrovirus-related Pol polyprotein from transposon opus [Gossypium australe]|uniref:Retrovirus-related Pol polyprotein from transposon opus n=1 Tax=Gossypium australe TaxID=47621 RepID=A0A5B6VXX5_9ROSI|nr:Retrovirus-related Pol polyprotein from transposon opus [Gossypium australe]
MLISRQVPPRLKDPRSFTVPIEIRDIHFIKALCDLGAGINLMPLSIYEKPGSLIQLKGVLEDVLVKVCNFIILADFVILDFEQDHEIPILLGRPFLATSRSTIDLEKNELTMNINGEMESFKCGHQQIGENKRKNQDTLEIEILGKNRVSVATRQPRVATPRPKLKESRKPTRCRDMESLCRDTKESIPKFQNFSVYRDIEPRCRESEKLLGMSRHRTLARHRYNFL